MPKLLTARSGQQSVFGAEALDGYTHTLGSNPMAPGRHRAVMSRVVAPLSHPVVISAKVWARLRSELYDQAGFPITDGSVEGDFRRYTETLEAVFNADVTVCDGWRCGSLTPSEMQLQRDTQFLVYYTETAAWGFSGHHLSVVWIGDKISIPIRRPEYYADPRGCRWGLTYQWQGGDDRTVVNRLVASFVVSMLTVGEFRRTARVELQPGISGNHKFVTISVGEDDFWPTGEDALMRPIEYVRQ